ncbi:MAG TPA: PEP-CTERM sorting domain-containing protein [Albitalea sp.]|nr:PEP-CTERM sorting domain-containing protein [Albitalea sp.]
MKFLAKTAIAVAAIAASAAASAVTITSYSFDGVGAFIKLGATTEGVGAGEITVNTDIGSFATYCIELTQGLGTPPASGYAFGSYANDLISRLVDVSGFYGGIPGVNAVDTTVEKAALQLDIWEAVYDSFPGDLSAGNFSVVNVSAPVLAQANAYLTAADALAPGSYPTNTLYAFTHRSRQDLVTSIPEPSTYMLMFAGLAGMGLVARRRNGQQS